MGSTRGNGNDPRPPTNGTNGKPPAQKKTLTLRELAYYLNSSSSSIYYAMRRGWLPARVEKLGQKRFDLDEVLEWLRRPGPPAVVAGFDARGVVGVIE